MANEADAQDSSTSESMTTLDIFGALSCLCLGNQAQSTCHSAVVTSPISIRSYSQPRRGPRAEIDIILGYVRTFGLLYLKNEQ